MTPRTFCYWLQGYFELVEPSHVPASSIKVIEAHLNIVEGPRQGFCAWLQGVLDMGGKNGWSNTQTQKVKEQLSQEFLKVIDASYEDSLRFALEKLHKGQSLEDPTAPRSHLSARPRPPDILC